MNTLSRIHSLEQFFGLKSYQQATVGKGCFFGASRSEIYDPLIDHHPGGKLLIAPIDILTRRKWNQFANPSQKLSNRNDLGRVQWSSDITHNLILSNPLTYGK